jgi:crotonobetainyl-CoA:carnitine CoA-transferase CaiB-like acyl-CoA transferase
MAPSISNSALLEGIRVLDITQVMAGPYCAMLLCDMGADVIKVEPPGGDWTRNLAGGIGGESPAFNAVNRGKRGIVLDLKDRVAQEIVARLAKSTDVIVENYRPGVMTRFGLDYPTLSVDNPGLIYASISGYGQTGPDASKGGFDLVAQGVSGLMSITGEPGRPPVKIGIPVTDLGAGLFTLSGILGALYARRRTGRGQLVDTSLVEAGVALSVWEATEYFSTGAVPQPTGSAHRLSAPYQALRCADGYITIGAANDRTFAKLCEILGRPEWVKDPRFTTNALRVESREALASLIEALTVAEPRAAWLQRFETAGIPCGPINTYEDVFRDRHLLAREMLVETDHPVLGRLRTLGTPIKMSGAPLNPRRRAPLLGEHTDEVLRSVGYGEEAIADLRKRNVVM